MDLTILKAAFLSALAPGSMVSMAGAVSTVVADSMVAEGFTVKVVSVAAKAFMVADSEAARAFMVEAASMEEAVSTAVVAFTVEAASMAVVDHMAADIGN
jgi:hypothetical protein